MATETQTHHSERGHSTRSDPDTNGLDEIAHFDESDAPEWSLPREWFIEGRYQLDWESI